MLLFFSCALIWSDVEKRRAAWGFERLNSGSSVRPMWSLLAEDERSLREISGAVHDAYFGSPAMKHSADERTVTTPFQQEGWPDGPRADLRLVAESWRFREYRVAFFHGTLTVRHVRTVAQPNGWDDSGMLLGVHFENAASEVRVCALDCLRLTVDALQVEVAISDNVAGYVRRRSGKWTRVESDTRLF